MLGVIDMIIILLPVQRLNRFHRCTKCLAKFRKNMRKPSSLSKGGIFRACWLDLEIFAFRLRFPLFWLKFRGSNVEHIQSAPATGENFNTRT